MKKIKMLATATIPLLLALMMARPTLAVKGPVMDKLQFKFYSTQSGMWTALVNGDIDVMGSPVTYDQYVEAATNPDILVAPYAGFSSYDISINNYKTIPTYPDWRSPSMINFDVCKYGPGGELLNNYPWDYNPSKAAEILDDADFVQGNTTNPDYDPTLPWSSQYLRVYPPGHEKNGTDLDPLIAYVRTELDARRQLMDQVAGDLRKLGIRVSTNYGTASVCWEPVYVYRDYHLYTGGVAMKPGVPTWLYDFNPKTDYPMKSCRRVHDEDVTPWTEKVMNATSVDEAVEAAKMVQYYQVMRAYSVPVWVPSTYLAYRKGICSAPSALASVWYEFGTRYGLDIPTMSMYSENYPTVNTIRYGTYDVPICINPLRILYMPEGQVADRIWTFPMASNPYNMGIGKSPTGGDLPWMAYDWNYQLSNFTGGGGQGNSSISYTNCANVTLWFRHDIKWNDGVPFTVDDLNESIAIYKYYTDSVSYSDALHVVNFLKIDDYTCSVYLDMPSVWSLYTVTGFHIFPKHIYGFASGKHHPLPTDADYYSGGPHGEWPWKDDTVTPVTDPAQVWVGSNLWKYVPGSYVSGAGGGILLEANPDFWMTVKPGEIDFAYTWNAGPPPQGGSYKIGLSDLVMIANAYGTKGTAPVPFKPLGGRGAWNPGADLASPSGRIGLSDLVTLARNYGKTWGTNP